MGAVLDLSVRKGVFIINLSLHGEEKCGERNCSLQKLLFRWGKIIYISPPLEIGTFRSLQWAWVRLKSEIGIGCLSILAGTSFRPFYCLAPGIFLAQAAPSFSSKPRPWNEYCSSFLYSPRAAEYDRIPKSSLPKPPLQTSSYDYFLLRDLLKGSCFSSMNISSGFKFHLSHFLVVWSWASFSNYLCLSFLVHQIECWWLYLSHRVNMKIKLVNIYKVLTMMCI